MVCKCGQECFYYKHVEAYLCPRCDRDDIISLAIETTNKILQDSYKREKELKSNVQNTGNDKE
jgi:hypothetical protein